MRELKTLHRYAQQIAKRLKTGKGPRLDDALLGHLKAIPECLAESLEGLVESSRKDIEEDSLAEAYL